MAKNPIINLGALVMGSLFLEFIANYFASYFLVWNSFRTVIFLVFLNVPALVMIFFKMKASEMGIRWPNFKRADIVCLMIVLVCISAIIAVIRYNTNYQASYTDFRNSGTIGERFVDFWIFTSSTLPPWEFFHRSFLLFGVFYILHKQARIDENLSKAIAILFVCAFEVLAHFVKPLYEPLGLLFGSPIFSFIALRTKSIIIPLIMHLYIEIMFFVFILS